MQLNKTIAGQKAQSDVAIYALSLSCGYMRNSCMQQLMQLLQRSARIAGNSKVMHTRIAHVTTALGQVRL